MATEPGATPVRPTVLVVEDEVLIRLVLADRLRDLGIQVLEASNAEEALTILESPLAVHVLFADIRMPGRMDGVGLSRFARKHYPHLKLILTSSHQPENYARASADVFVAKHYDLDTVVQQVETLLIDSGYEFRDR
ncbi:MAG: response regulator [Methylocella sp.]